MKPHRWHWMAAMLAVALLLAAGIGPAAAQQGGFEAIGGGTAAITGLQGTSLTAQTTGIGQVTFPGPPPLVLNAALLLKFVIDAAKNPSPIRNGTLTVTASSGDEVQAVLEGQVSAPDASGFSNASATFTVTGGTGRCSGVSGGGTVVGVVNFARSAFSAAVKGTLTPAKK